jgi:uncharacterized membrane protein YeaQ/YmgE (transglycosylase-associated protein family)
MTLLFWIVLGLLAGFIGSKIVNKRGEGLLRDSFLGITGAVLGGFAFSSYATEVNLYSLFVPVIGAFACLLLYHAIRRSAA